MKKGIVVMLVMAGVAFAMTGAASAALIVVGDPQLTGSWTQTFFKSGGDNFDRIDVHVESGTTLKGGGFENFSRGDWGGSRSSDGHSGSFSGGDTNGLGFDFHVATDVFESFRVCFETYDNDQLREIEHASWDGHCWQIDRECPPANQIPEPGTMLLLGAGLVGLASFGRKKLGKK